MALFAVVLLGAFVVLGASVAFESERLVDSICSTTGLSVGRSTLTKGEGVGASTGALVVLFVGLELGSTTGASVGLSTLTMGGGVGASTGASVALLGLELGSITGASVGRSTLTKGEGVGASIGALVVLLSS